MAQTSGATDASSASVHPVIVWTVAVAMVGYTRSLLVWTYWLQEALAGQCWARPLGRWEQLRQVQRAWFLQPASAPVFSIEGHSLYFNRSNSSVLPPETLP